MRYFAIRDSIDSGEIKIHHVGTDDMIGDFFTKPLQGKNLRISGISFWALKILLLTGAVGRTPRGDQAALRKWHQT